MHYTVAIFGNSDFMVPTIDNLEKSIATPNRKSLQKDLALRHEYPRINPQDPCVSVIL